MHVAVNKLKIRPICDRMIKVHLKRLHKVHHKYSQSNLSLAKF